MPWQSSTPMDYRVQFVSDYQRRCFSLSELCNRFGISRKTGYKWLDYYAEQGPAGLADHSRRPQSSPTAMPKKVRDQVLDLRGRHPTWGAKKLLAWLAKHGESDDGWPARSTVCRLLQQEGLVSPRRASAPGAARSRVEHVPRSPRTSSGPPTSRRVPDGRWSVLLPADRDGRSSRYLLECHGMDRIAVNETRRCFERLFRAFGLPAVMRSDNGTPFASPALAGLSRLSVWWIQLDIELDRITPDIPRRTGASNAFTGP